MSETAWAGVEAIRCPEIGCDWHVDQGFPSREQHQFNLDALTGHQLREHPAAHIAADRYGSPSLEEIMRVECPFKDEAMRAAFYVGWLAGMR